MRTGITVVVIGVLLVLPRVALSQETHPPKPAKRAELAGAVPQGFRLRTVVIDPGHGGKDPGNISPHGIKEKQINLAVAKYLAQELKRRGLEVHLLRDSDRHLSLEQRGLLANTHPPQETLFISIHCNAWRGPQVSGLETYVFDYTASDETAAEVASRENADDSMNPLDFILGSLNHRGSERYSVTAARTIQRRLVSQLGLRDRRVRRAPFRVLGYVHMPAVLVELGFLSHPEEERQLRSARHQRRLAQTLTDAILEFQQNVAHRTDTRAALNR